MKIANTHGILFDISEKYLVVSFFFGRVYKCPTFINFHKIRFFWAVVTTHGKKHGFNYNWDNEYNECLPQTECDGSACQEKSI